MILDESLFEDNISEEKNRKIQIFGDGEYLFTTDNYSTIKDVVKEFKDRGEFTVASLPKDRKVKFSDYKKVTGKFKEDLDERVDEYLQYDAKLLLLLSRLREMKMTKKSSTTMSFFSMRRNRRK